MILEAQPDIEVVAEAADGEAAVRLDAAPQARRRPDGHPDAGPRWARGDAPPAATGPPPIRRSAGVRPPRIVILTTFDLDEYVYAALRSGASGFLLKDVSPEHLVGAVRTVAVGDALLSPSITRRLVERYAQPQAAPGAAAGGAGDA